MARYVVVDGLGSVIRGLANPICANCAKRIKWAHRIDGWFHTGNSSVWCSEDDESDVAEPVPGLKGAAGPDDLEAGYRVCMFCEETGDVQLHAGHDVVWDVWKDRMADARNSAF